MDLNDISALFQRDLERLSEELQQFNKESNIWMVTGQIANSAGNLCLHLNGNLNHFIGSILGNTGYVRKREAEFAEKDVPRDALITMTNETGKMLADVLKSLKPEQLKVDFPIEVFGYAMTTNYFLIHLHGHLNYHLGQINYLRRMLDH